MRGMSSIVAVVLLVIITVALVGVVATNFQSLTQSSAQQAQQQTEATSQRLTQTVRIESASGTELVVRSTGTTTVQTSKLAVFIDSVLTGCTWDVAEMEQDELAICVYAAPCAPDSEVKVISPGNVHTAKC